MVEKLKDDVERGGRNKRVLTQMQLEEKLVKRLVYLTNVMATGRKHASTRDCYIIPCFRGRKAGRSEGRQGYTKTGKRGVSRAKKNKESKKSMKT